MNHQSAIREEELKNRVAATYFGKYDCTRIVGNIDFCVSPKRRDSRQMTFVPDAPILWAEAKNHPTDVYRMLAQLILTIKGEQKGDMEPPRFVGCFDNEKIAFVEYHYILPVFNLNDFNWTQTPSAVDDKTVETVRGVIPRDKFVVFRFVSDDAEIKAFIARNFAFGDAPVLATPIDRNNFTFIYQKWRNEVMPHIDAPWDVLKKKYALYDRDFFLAEMNVDDNGTPEVSDDRPAEDFYITFDATAREPYTIRRKNEDELNFNLTFGFKPGGLDAYAAFWRRYKRPPKREYWDFIVSRLDLLVPQDVRERKGSFFTPAIWVEKSQQYLAAVLGENWQDEHYVWDCAGGTGNLEVGLTNKYRVWVSTLDQQDVDVVHERIKNGANLLDSHVFRFDFLNDSFDKLPEDLRDVINDPEKRKRLVTYINPPYAEHSNRKVIVGTGENRANVAKESRIYEEFVGMVGTATRELYIQFFLRIYKELHGATLASFSTMKFVCSQNCAKFRKYWTAAFRNGFICPADTFDNVSGSFPIAFTIWHLDGSKEICGANVDVMDRDSHLLGTRNFHSSISGEMISDWLRKYYDAHSSETLAYMSLPGVSMQQRASLFITSKPTESDVRQHKVARITPLNLIPFTVYLAVRHCIALSWENNKDEFCHPIDKWMLDEEFKSDCLVFTLFDNVVKSADGVNHWIPFTEEEVEAKACFKSHFMSDFIKGRAASNTRRVENNTPYQGELGFESDDSLTDDQSHNLHDSETPSGESNNTLQTSRTLREALSPAARAVLDAGRELWKYYHAQPDANPNASYYDIRAHFQGCKPNGAMNAKSSDATYNALISALRTAHKALAAQVEPKVYEYGFLKR